MASTTKIRESLPALRLKKAAWLGLAALCASNCAWITEADLEARFDLDNDGISRPTDCDDLDAEVGITTLYVDRDLDGIGDGNSPKVEACSERVGLSAMSGDCDDFDAGAYPGATEVCNQADDDCDGVFDEDPIDPQQWFLDRDRDGFGDPTVETLACIAPDGFVRNSEDCDDEDPNITEGFTYYQDHDGDRWGNGSRPVLSCTQPAGTVPNQGDCDDENALIHPFQNELCDDLGLDEDCDGLVNDADDNLSGRTAFFLDEDGDGWGNPRRATLACATAAGRVENGDDCDDADPELGGGDCPWVAVAAGSQASCGLRSDLRAECWGSGGAVDSLDPDARFEQISVGAGFACGIALDGSLACWGDLSSTDFELGTAAVELECDGAYTCAVTAASVGSVACWDGPLQVELRLGTEPFVQVAAGTRHACGLQSTGIWCFGTCDMGECGEMPGTWSDVAAGYGYSCALDQEGRMDCWGSHGLDLSSMADLSAIEAYLGQLCAIGPGGELFCWNALTGEQVLTPSGTFVSVAPGLLHGCALRDDGEIVCWGSDADGAATPP
jgi:hypothetical protein